MKAGRVALVVVLLFFGTFASTMGVAAAAAAFGGGGQSVGQAGGPVSGDAIALAQELVTANKDGRLRFLETRYQAQVVNMANGTAAPGCQIDVRTLQIMVVVVRAFKSVGVSDINRHCTGSLLGGGTESSHWINGGGGAVDFYSLNGTALNGYNNLDLQLIQLLDPIVPKGSRIGQVECRASHGDAVSTRNFTQFEDTCNHQHVDVAYAKGGLSVTPAPASTPGAP